MGAANANDNDFSDGDDMGNDEFGEQFPQGLNDENEEHKAGEEFGDFPFEIENSGSQQASRQRNQSSLLDENIARFGLRNDRNIRPSESGPGRMQLGPTRSANYPGDGASRSNRNHGERARMIGGPQ